MNDFHLEISGIELARLLSTIDTINKELAKVRGDANPTATDSPFHALDKAWQHLVTQLEVKPEPKRRECPTCLHRCLQGASRCGYCWHPLPVEKAAEGLA